MADQKQPQDIYQLPVFQESSKEQVLAKYKQGVYTQDDLQTYKAGTLVRDHSFLGAPKESVFHLYKQGYFSKEQLNLYKDSFQHADDANYRPGPGLYALNRAIQGASPEEIEAECGGVKQLVYDPIDLAGDIVTGGATAVLRTGGKALVKQGAKLAGKFVAKEAVKDAALGAAAGGGMAAVDEMGGGMLTQVLGGIVGGVGASAILAGGRQGLIRFMRRARKDNPELADSVEKAIRESTDPQAKVYQEQLDKMADATLDTTQPYVFTKKYEMDEDAATKAAKGAKESAEAGTTKANPKPMQLTEEQVSQIMRKTVDGSTEGDAALMKQVMDTDAHGADFFHAVDTIAQKEVANAKGGPMRRSLSEMEAREKIKTEFTKFEELTGHRVIDLEKAFVDASDMAGSMEKMHVRMNAHGSMLVKLSALADKMVNQALEKGATYTDMLKAQEMTKLFGEYDAAIQLVRSQYGRGLNMLNNKWKKTRFDFDSIPRTDLDASEDMAKKQLKEYLKKFKKAKNLKQKRQVAGDSENMRFLKAAHEWQVGAMLMHYKTWMVNILGNSVANLWYMGGRAGGATAEAIRTKSFKVIQNAGEAEALAWKDAYNTLFKAPEFGKAFKKAKADGKGNTKAIYGMLKEMGEGESGTFWKALWSGEGQIDPHLRFEGQGGSSLEYAASHIKQRKDGSWIGAPAWAYMPVAKFMHHGLRVLTAGDEIFKTIAYHQKRNSGLYREAMQLKDQSKMTDYIKKRVTQLNAEDPIEQAAIKEMRELTFVSPLEGVARDAEKAMSGSRAGMAVRMTALPFFKIAVNLNKFAVKNTPLALASKKFRQTMANGTVEEKAEQWTRMSIGLAMLTGGAMMHENDVITGRMDRRDWSAQENAKVMEYSVVKHDDDGNITGFVDFSRLDPASILVGIGAGLSEVQDRMADLVLDDKSEDEFDAAMKETMLASVLAFADPTLNKSFMQSLEQTAALWFVPERTNFSKWSAMQARKFVPRTVDIVNDFTNRDEIIRDIQNPIDVFLNAFNAKKLPPKRHAIYGTVRTKEDPWMALARQRQSDDPVAHELMRLGVQAAPMPRSITLKGEAKKLTPHQYDKMVSYLEQTEVKTVLADAIKDLAEVKDDKTKAQFLSTIISDSRGLAKALFLESEYGQPIQQSLFAEMELRSKAIDGLIEKRNPRTRFYKFLDTRR